MSFTLRELADFAWGQGARKYEYGDNRGCAICQFLKASGRASEPNVGADGWSDLDEISLNRRLLPNGANSAVVASPRTFFDLALRLELILAQVGTHPKGGDAKQAPALLSDAVGEAHSPNPADPTIPNNPTSSMGELK